MGGECPASLKNSLTPITPPLLMHSLVPFQQRFCTETSGGGGDNGGGDCDGDRHLEMVIGVEDFDKIQN